MGTKAARRLAVGHGVWSLESRVCLDTEYSFQYKSTHQPLGIRLSTQRLDNRRRHVHNPT
jgi:hypothetical protein